MSIYIHLCLYTISYSMYVYSEFQLVFKTVFFVRFECVNIYICIDNIDAHKLFLNSNRYSQHLALQRGKSFCKYKWMDT